LLRRQWGSVRADSSGSSICIKMAWMMKKTEYKSWKPVEFRSDFHKMDCLHANQNPVRSTPFAVDSRYVISYTRISVQQFSRLDTGTYRRKDIRPSFWVLF